MEFQPYGPIEASMENSSIHTGVPAKSNYKLWLGVFVIALAGGIIYLVVKKNKSAKDKRDEHL